MNYKQVAQASLLAALIVSPVTVLLALQLPFWLPPKLDALERVVYAWEFRGPTFWAIAGEPTTSACACVGQRNDCEVLQTSGDADGAWVPPLELLRFGSASF